MKLFRHLLPATLLILLPSLALAGYCPDYSVTQTQPSAPVPTQKGFLHFGSTLISALYTPYHLVHDQVVASGQSATIVGKFDYDWLLHKDLEGEYVHAYLYGTGMSSWQYLGKFKTDNNGKIYVPVSAQPEGDYIVRMVVEGDLSEATGYLTVASSGRQTILFDIDGTITKNDFEAVGDYLGADVAQNYPYAVAMVDEYVAKGYQVVFLSARPYWVTKSTRQWSDYYQMVPWHLHVTDSAGFLSSTATEQFKANYINYLKNTVGLNIVRAYGNATTDIAAYADAGIAKSDTYIIGTNAGVDGTQAITGDYQQHYYSVVVNQAYASCTPH